MSNSLSRRDMLVGGSRALLAGACLPTLRGFHNIGEAALASLGSAPPPDYRALVCVFLEGGNDSFNMVAPRDSSGYGVYAASRGGLAVPQGQLLAINPLSGGDSRQWGFHPSAPGLRDLFEAGHLSILANVGTLLAPMTKQQSVNNTVPKPAQLFSHSDQSTLWQLPSARDDVQHGWAGRMSDLLLPMNNGALLSPAISMAGSARLLRGQTVVPYTMSAEGSIALTGTWGADGTRRFQTLRQLFANAQPQVMQREIANLQEQAITLDGTIRSSLAAAPALATQFPSTNLAQQLRMVARMISAREGLGAGRQVYFVRQGGYDTHANQLGNHPALLAELSGALVAFQAAMAELGVNSQVTTCTMSEFGRTLTSNANGSDHGWGGHQMIMGGSVQGRRIYGTMPNLALNGPDDSGLGRIIPTTAVDQYAATMAKWFGVSAGSMSSLFPRLSQFATPDLGFLV